MTGRRLLFRTQQLAHLFMQQHTRLVFLWICRHTGGNPNNIKPCADDMHANLGEPQGFQVPGFPVRTGALQRTNTTQTSHEEALASVSRQCRFYPVSRGLRSSLYPSIGITPSLGKKKSHCFISETAQKHQKQLLKGLLAMLACRSIRYLLTASSLCRYLRVTAYAACTAQKSAVPRYTGTSILSRPPIIGYVQAVKTHHYACWGPKRYCCLTGHTESMSTAVVAPRRPLGGNNKNVIADRCGDFLVTAAYAAPRRDKKKYGAPYHSSNTPARSAKEKPGRLLFLLYAHGTAVGGPAGVTTAADSYSKAAMSEEKAKAPSQLDRQNPPTAGGRQRPVSAAPAAAARGEFFIRSSVQRPQPLFSSLAASKIRPESVLVTPPPASVRPSAFTTRISTVVTCRYTADALTAVPVSLAASTETASEAPTLSSSTSTFTTTQFLSAPASPPPTVTALYPFRSIEEKWVRYYAEHCEDFSPPLPSSEHAIDEHVVSAGLSNDLRTSNAVAIPHFSTSPRILGETPHAPEASAIEWGLTKFLTQQKGPTNSAEKIGANVHVSAHSRTDAPQPLDIPKRDLDEGAAENVKTSHLYAKGARGQQTFLPPIECSTQACDGFGEHQKSLSKKASFLKPQTLVQTENLSAICIQGTRGQHDTAKYVEKNAETNVEAKGARCSSCSHSQLGNAEHDDTRQQRSEKLKKTDIPSMPQKPRGMQDFPCTAETPVRTAHVALSEDAKKASEDGAHRPAILSSGGPQRNKFYVLSMIPYPSGEGLHVGHCLTYTVADVVARYKRLQLRGELLRSKTHGGGAAGDINVDEGGGRLQLVQKQHHQCEERKKSGEERSILSRDTVVCEVSSTSEQTPASSEQPTSEDKVSTRPIDGKRGSCEQARWQANGNGKSPSLRRGPEKNKVKVSFSQGEKKKQRDLPRVPQQPDVMHVMGWDSFGLPAEQHALISGIPPRLSVRKNIGRFRRQLQRLGLAVDWRREIDTSDPDYFRWTQWIFLQMWKRGLVYEKAAPVNWCESLVRLASGTVLADEEVVNGVSTRGQHPVEKKCLVQWHLRITAYADELERSLRSLDWPEDVKVMQRNWIGKRELLYLTLPLVRLPAALHKREAMRGGRDLNDYCASGMFRVRSSCESATCQYVSSNTTTHAFDLDNEGNNNILLQDGVVNPQDTFSPSHTAPKGAGAPGRSAGWNTDPDKGPPSLRCVSVSPEFLFGVTFVVVHAAHKQAHAAAVSKAAREWLSAQYYEPVAEEHSHCGSATLAKPDALVAGVQRGAFTSKHRVDGAKAGILNCENGAVATRDTSEDAVLESRRYMQSFNIRNTPFENKSVFSGSYVQHPITGAALPVWLWVGELFNRLRGAGTYFDEDDAVLAVPHHDSFARTFAHAAGLPIVNVFAPKAVEKKALHPREQTVRVGNKTVPLSDECNQYFCAEDGVASQQLVQGVLVNSRSENVDLNGLSRTEARRQLLEHLAAQKIGKQRYGYALKDWVFSRQRFWGEPIPLMKAYAEDGKQSVMAESESHLPVTLPEKLFGREHGTHKGSTALPAEGLPAVSSACSPAEYKKVPLPEKESHVCEGKVASVAVSRERYMRPDSLMAPLAAYMQWWNLTPTDIQHTGAAEVRRRLLVHEDVGDLATAAEAGNAEKKGRIVELHREVSTMPQWAGSSWYFLRFLDPRNRRAAFGKELARYWMPVDLYVGGKEHAVTHLLYARFWHKVLRDVGAVTCGEPFKRLCTPGIVLGTPQYVAFQRLDTGEWVSSSSVCLKQGDPPESHLSQESYSGTAKQSMAQRSSSATVAKDASVVTTQRDQDVDAGSTSKSNVNEAVGVFRTVRKPATGRESTVVKDTSHHGTSGWMHVPSGQPVRQVQVGALAVKHVKGTDVPVLKEDENIEVLCRHEKMSKSRGNVISPDDLIEAYGADALRLHLIFMGPVEARKVWSLDGIKGVSRFLRRMWHLIISKRNESMPTAGPVVPVAPDSSSSYMPSFSTRAVEDLPLGTKIIEGPSKESPSQPKEHREFLSAEHGEKSSTVDCLGQGQALNLPLETEICSQIRDTELTAFEKTLLRGVVERVTRHIERLAFNTALAVLMCTVKKLSQWKAEGNTLSVRAALILIKLLHPFAPFITEELWYKIHQQFPGISRCASTPSLMACGVWPTSSDPEFNTCEDADRESDTAGNLDMQTGTLTGTVPSTDVAVHFDGKFYLNVRVPPFLMSDNTTLEEYVRRNPRVEKIFADGLFSSFLAPAAAVQAAAFVPADEVIAPGDTTRSSSTGRPKEKRTLWMGDLDRAEVPVDEAYVRSDMFMEFNSFITHVRVCRDKLTRLPSFGFVEFATEKHASYVLEHMNGRFVPRRCHKYKLNWASFNLTEKPETRITFSRPPELHRNHETNSATSESNGKRTSDSSTRSQSLTAPPSDSTSIWVGSLDPATSREEVESLFQQHYNTVCFVKLIADNATGLCRGFGFVHFRSAEEAERALGEMNGAICRGRRIRVNRSNSSGGRSSSGSTLATAQDPNVQSAMAKLYAATAYQAQKIAKDYCGGFVPTKRRRGILASGAPAKVAVRGLDPVCREEEIEKHLAHFGEILHTKVVPGGKAYVTFAEPAAAENAVTYLSGCFIGANRVVLEHASDAHTEAGAVDTSGNASYYWNANTNAANYAVAAHVGEATNAPGTAAAVCSGTEVYWHQQQQPLAALCGGTADIWQTNAVDNQYNMYQYVYCNGLASAEGCTSLLGGQYGYNYATLLAGGSTGGMQSVTSDVETNAAQDETRKACLNHAKRKGLLAASEEELSGGLFHDVDPAMVPADMLPAPMMAYHAVVVNGTLERHTFFKWSACPFGVYGVADTPEEQAIFQKFSDEDEVCYAMLEAQRHEAAAARRAHPLKTSNEEDYEILYSTPYAGDLPL